jgi:hypothetical protein
MNAGEARAVAARWLEANRERWPELRAAHLVGGVTSMLDDEPFPASKDLDLHLVLDAGSPLLEQMGPIQNLIEEEFEGLAIEAGPKSIDDYSAAGVVLANPEIAHHLTTDCILYDPAGLLAGLQPEVRRRYADRKWVEARVNREREGFEAALAMRPMGAAMYGASAEANLLGYAHTYLTAAMDVANLRPPQIGGRSFARLRQSLARAERLDLYDRLLAILGLAGMSPERASRLVDEAAELFDVAVVSRKTPHPFQHKFHAHLRPYVVDACREMIAEGNHREAAGWATPFLLSAADIIGVDGPNEARERAAGLQRALLEDLGLATADALDRRYEAMAALGNDVFWLIGELVRDNPAVHAGRASVAPVEVHIASDTARRKRRKK